jgi:hypothetical protein
MDDALLALYTMLPLLRIKFYHLYFFYFQNLIFNLFSLKNTQKHDRDLNSFIFNFKILFNQSKNTK